MRHFATFVITILAAMAVGAGFTALIVGLR